VVQSVARTRPICIRSISITNYLYCKYITLSTFATERVGLMGIEELRALMGHANIQTTLRYQKVTSNRAEEVAKKALKTLANNYKCYL